LGGCSTRHSKGAGDAIPGRLKGRVNELEYEFAWTPSPGKSHEGEEEEIRGKDEKA